MKTNEQRLRFIRTVSREYDPPNIYFFGTKYFGEMKLDNGAKIGQDGFGWEWDGKRLIKFPHRGDVLIHEDVEIGANTCIDRATVEDEATEIGKGTKIDNLVHIAHNVKIGEHCLIVAGAVLCGSVTIGDRTIIGANATILEHIKVGSDAFIGAGSVVTKDVPDGEVWCGVPAKYLRENT